MKKDGKIQRLSYNKDRKKESAAPIPAKEQEPQPHLSVSALVTKDWQSQQQDKPTVLTSFNPVGGIMLPPVGTR